MGGMSGEGGLVFMSNPLMVKELLPLQPQSGPLATPSHAF